MTGGDDITARAPTQRTTRSSPGKSSATDNRPAINGTDNGIYRQLQIIPCQRILTADEQDPCLQKILEGEMPRIVNRALGGCVQWQQTRLAPPFKVLRQLNHYKRDIDTAAKFVEDQLVRAPQARLASGQL